MGILSNTVSLVQFIVSGKLPSTNLDQWIGKQLSQNGFRPIDDSVDEESFGWVALDDNLSSDFSNSFSYKRDHYIVATYRHDKRKVSTFLSRHTFARESEKWLELHPQITRVPKQAREDIKDRVMFGLLSKTLPTPATFDLVWDTQKGVLILATTSLKNMDLVQDLFHQTFPTLKISLIHPIAMAKLVLEEKFHRAVDKANKASEKDVVSQIRDNQWIGQDFLFWLMHNTIETSSVYKTCVAGPAEQGAEFVAYIEDKVVLSAMEEQTVKKSAITGPLSDFAEARSALEAGKLMQEATIIFEVGDNEWKLNLKGETFSFGSYKCPAVQIEKDEITDPAAEKEAVFFERMHLIESGCQLFDSLYSQFLQARLSGKWPKTLAQMKNALLEK